MSGAVRIGAAAAAAAICTVAIRKQAPEIALGLGLSAGALLVLWCSGALSAVLNFLDRLAETGGLSPAVLEPVVKTAGIAVVTHMAAAFCRDAQESALASAVELAGTALALAAALPLMSAVLELLTGLL